MSTVDLLIPGLFDHLSGWLEEYQDHPSAPLLEKVLSRADQTKTHEYSFEEQLWKLFKKEAESESDQSIPFASLELINTTDSYICRADPVHFYTDVTALYLRETTLPDLSAEDRKELETLINSLIDEDGITFILYPSGAGYLVFSEAKALNSFLPSRCLGQSVFSYLPSGNDTQESAYWNRLQSELQMLLFSAPLNDRREAEGKARISSLWLWGEAKESVGIHSRYDHVFADDNCSLELARFTETPQSSYMKGLESLEQAESNYLFVNTRFQKAGAYDDYREWLQSLEQLEESFLRRVFEQLESKTIKCLRIFDANGVAYTFKSINHRYFWRRIRTIKQLAKRSEKVMQ